MNARDGPPCHGVCESGSAGVSRIADCTEFNITFGGSEVFEPLDDVFAGAPTAFRLPGREREVSQAPAGRFFSPARRTAVTATPRQMTGEEARDAPLIALPVAFQLFVQVPAEVNDGVPVIPARPLGIAALAQPLDQPGGLRSERDILSRDAKLM